MKLVEEKLFKGAVVVSVVDLMRCRTLVPDNAVVLHDEGARSWTRGPTGRLAGAIRPEVIEGAVAAFWEVPAGYAAESASPRMGGRSWSR